jgi:FKBP12-rapamycin complex-associated protein
MRHEKDVEAVSKIAEKLRNALTSPTSLYDRQFLIKSSHVHELRKLLDCMIGKKALNVNDLEKLRSHKAKIQKHIDGPTVLSLSSLAPEIARVNPGTVAVPNTTEPGKPRVTINRFENKVRIKKTKQLPRKLKIIGDNGVVYRFLLKGKEDLRQDQRVLQFFELANAFVSEKITITGVTPLSPRCGLIQWIRKCDTIHQLVCEYRGYVDVGKDQTSSPVDVDRLRPIQRLERLRTIFAETPANDLRDCMWLKCRDSEIWVKHVLKFSRSTAVMSIMGYIIGLGDRHPANIMIQRSSGGVVHVDFGDCFEVTRKRMIMAEEVPFRLTRMMIAAFGPCKTEGSFRRTCEATVREVRVHREAIMAVLEIFLREPVRSGGIFETGDEKAKEKLYLEEQMNRMIEKINGMDFDNKEPLEVGEQVDKLIAAATDTYNLAQLYHGWNPTW